MNKILFNVIAVVFLSLQVLIAECPDNFVENQQYPANGPECFPEEFVYFSSTQLGFYYFYESTINDVSIDENDWVAAFNGSVCVGSRKWGECQDSGGCDVPVLGDDGSQYTSGYMTNGTAPSFKIYDVSENIYIDATSSQNISWYPFSSPLIDLLYSYATIEGCIDQFACNQDPYASIDDGSCEYCSCELDANIIYDWDTNYDGVLDNYNNYEFNGSLTSVVLENNDNIISENDLLAAFYGNEQRGVAIPTEIPPQLGQGYAFLMMIYSNQSSFEELTFKYYHSSSNRVYCLDESIVFESNMVIGDVINPFEFLINSDWLSVDEIPQEFLITSVYPNPFNPSVSIEYNVIEISNIAFNFFDITGNLIDSKNIGYTSPGNYKFFWENKNIPSGTYFIVMTDGISKNTRKITLVK
tara:strand:+ start:558 stop:1796 length:1239 start_codon:yes stop_codon:yes gene_type:complete